MIRKHVLCMLVCLLAFGVVGVVDAITRLEAKSPTVLSIRVGDPFEIKFNVTLQGSVIIRDGNLYKLEDDTLVNSSGYKIEASTLDGGYYILPDTTYTVPSGTTAIVGSQHSYQFKSGNTGETNNFVEAEGKYYVDTSGNVKDARGRAVYLRTNTGLRLVTDENGNVTQQDTRYSYQRAKTTPPTKTLDSNRYYYNDEAVTITSADLTVRLPNEFPVSGRTLSEIDHADSRLKSSMTLKGQATAVGSFTIRIEDATPATDYPMGSLAATLAGASPREPRITFTVNVSALGVASTGRLRTTRDTESVSNQFKGTDGTTAIAIDGVTVPDNTDIIYRVTRGSGTLYYSGQTPTTVLTVHKDVDVYINMNGADNIVEASIIGGDHIVRRESVVFEYIGSGPVRNPDPPASRDPVVPPQRSITVSASPSSAAPGNTVVVTAFLSDSLSNIPVTFSTTASGVFFSPPPLTSAGRTQSQFVVPSGVSSMTINAVAGNYLAGSTTITITGTTTTTTTTTEPEVLEPASIEIYDGDDQQGEIGRTLDEDLAVEVLDRNDRGVSFEVISLRVVEGSGRFSPTRPRTDRNGRAYFSFTPRSPGSQGTIEIEASVADISPVTFTVNVGEPPDAIKKISGDNQSGRPSARLANPFVVEVVDENDDPVSGATVAFSVTAGGGSVSPTSATTNASGRAQTVLTLGEEIGNNTVSARVTGLTGVTFRAGAGAEVRVDASNRVPIYWIDKQNGTLHRLVDDDVENLASNVEGVTSLAVDEANGLIYWGVQVGRSGGKIQRSRLNGRNIQTLKDGLTSVPMGIALDSAGGTIYWTSASGKIRSMATEGSTKVTKIVEDLSDPTSLAVSNGYLYWAEPLGRVRRVSLTATRKVAANIATGLGEPLTIAIAKGKIYWVERNGGKGGSLQRANLNGTQIEELKAFTGGVPLGIAIDSSANKIYWTKLSKIQRTNLSGRSVIDVVTGLTRPGTIALGVVADDEPAVQTTRRTQTTQTTQTTTQTTYSKYDINKDGSVNNADTKVVAGAVGQSGAAITNPRTDVDGSGTVDVTDLILVIANLDDDVAAPAIDVDLTAMDLDFDRVQEQIAVLLASGDRSHAAERALMYLQHLLASARPDVTVLLANYPNPFNPETWIPYHLATSTDVRINIYNAQGILVRALTLGHQTAGYYTSRSRAVYWDGRNALGERVASGIYFYQLQADEISPMRKMVILK